jgi:hypothetical protein
MQFSSVDKSKRTSSLIVTRNPSTKPAHLPPSVRIHDFEPPALLKLKAVGALRTYYIVMNSRFPRDLNNRRGTGDLDHNLR